MKLKISKKYRVVEMDDFEAIANIDTEDPIYVYGTDQFWYPITLNKDEFIIPVWKKDTYGDLLYRDIIEYLLVTIEVQLIDPEGGYSGEIVVIERFHPDFIKLIKTPKPDQWDSMWPTDVWDINSIHHAILKSKKIL